MGCSLPLLPGSPFRFGLLFRVEAVRRRAVEGDVPLLLVVRRLIPNALAFHPPLEPHHHPVHLLRGAEEEEAAVVVLFMYVTHIVYLRRRPPRPLRDAQARRPSAGVRRHLIIRSRLRLARERFEGSQPVPVRVPRGVAPKFPVPKKPLHAPVFQRVVGQHHDAPALRHYSW